MANIRGAAAYEGTLDPKLLSYAKDSSITYTASNYDGSFHSPQLPTSKPGAAVTLTGSGQVGLGASGNELCGRLESVEADGEVSVTVSGLIGFTYLGGAVPVVGRGVVVDGAGNVLTPAGGTRTVAERSTVVEALDTTNLIAYVKLA